MKFYLLILFIISCNGDPRELQILPWLKSASSKQQGKFIQKQKWKLQAFLVRTATLSYIDKSLEEMNVPAEEKAKIHKTADLVVNKTIDLYASMNDTQRAKIEKFIKKVPQQLSSLTKAKQTQSYQDLKYFQSLDLTRQTELYGHIAQQISQMDFGNQAEEVQNLDSVLTKIHELIQTDMKDPQQQYDLSQIWMPTTVDLDADGQVSEQLEDLLADRNISKALDGFLAGSQNINLNQTFQEMVKHNRSRLNSTKREEMRQHLDDYVKNNNPFSLPDFTILQADKQKQNITIEHTFNQTNSSSALVSTQQNIKVSRLPFYLASTVIVMLLIGIGYFFKRRNDYKNRFQPQDQVELDQDVSL